MTKPLREMPGIDPEKVDGFYASLFSQYQGMEIDDVGPLVADHFGIDPEDRLGIACVKRVLAVQLPAWFGYSQPTRRDRHDPIDDIVQRASNLTGGVK